MHITFDKSQKRTLALAVVALVAMLGIAGTLAFTVGMVPADNAISFGSVKVRVCEFVLDEAGNERPFEADANGDYPATKASAGKISRIVRVQNVGSQPEYVRARLSMKAVASDGREYDAANAATLDTNTATGAPWVAGDDGWYYYRGVDGSGGVLQPKGMTENLLNSLNFVGDYYAAAHGGSYRLDVDVQAVQAKNQQIDGTPLDVLDVRGWPESR